MTALLLIMGLLPLAILPEIMSSDDEEPEEEQVDTWQPDVLLPTNEDDVADLLAEPVDPGSILAPEPDAPDLPGSEVPTTDPLAPVTEIESSNGTLALNFEEVTATGYVEIENFDPEADVLTILIEQSSVEGQADLQVAPGTDPNDVNVWLEGQLVAVLRNAIGADASNVVVNLTG